MLNLKSLLVTAFGFAVTFFVPAVVWITLTAGLIQLIHSRVHWLGDIRSASRRLAQESVH